MITAVSLSAGMFSFPTLNDLRIFAENLLACQAEFTRFTFAYLNKIIWWVDVVSSISLQ